MANADTGIDFVAGDTNSALQLTIKDRDTNSAVDLTGGSVTLYWKIVGNDGEKSGPRQSASMTLTTPASGICTYTWTANDLDPPSEVIGEPKAYRAICEAVFTNGSGNTLTTLNTIELNIRSRFTA